MTIAALTNALTGLKTSQRALGVISDNIANANTEGYTRKIADLSSLVYDGRGAGVEIARISRNVDEYLMRDRRDEVSELKEVEVMGRYLERIQDFFGEPADNNSVAALVNKLQTSLEQYELDPEDQFNAKTVVDAAGALGQQLETMYFELQHMRGQADQEIGTRVAEINSLLGQIDTYNVEIVRDVARDMDTGALRDKRDVALNRLAELVDISYYERGGGDVVISTRGGTTLLDVDPLTVSFSTATDLRSEIRYDPDRLPGTATVGTISGIYVGDVQTEMSDITTELRGGEIKGLIDIRDTLIPGLVDELNTLSSTLRDEINRIHNLGTSFPPPNQLTTSVGFFNPNTALNTDEPLTAANFDLGLRDTTGLVPRQEQLLRISVINRGTPISSRGDVVTTNTIDLAEMVNAAGGTATMQDLLNRINTVFNGVVTASFNNGQLTLQANDPNNGLVIDVPENVLRSDPTALVDPTANVATTQIGDVIHFFDDNNALIGSATMTDSNGDGNLTYQEVVDSINAVTGMSARFSMTTAAATSQIEITKDDGQAFTLSYDTGYFAATTAVAPGSGLAALATNTGINHGDTLTTNTGATVTFSNAAAAGALTFEEVIDQINTQLGGVATATLVQQGANYRIRLGNNGTSGFSLAGAGTANAQFTGTPTNMADLGLTGTHTSQAASFNIATTKGFPEADEAVRLYDGADSELATNTLNISIKRESAAAFTAIPGITWNSTLEEIAIAINGMDVDGDLVADFQARVIKEDGYKLQIIDRVSNEVIQFSGDDASVLGFGTDPSEYNDSRGFSHMMGLNDLFVSGDSYSAMQSLNVRSDIAADPTLLAGAQANNSLLTGATGIAAGNNEGAKALSAGFLSSISFNSAGDLPDIETTLSGYATRILSNQALKTSTNKNDVEFREEVVNELEFRIEGISGVNMDEELSNLILFQNAYTAAARVISAAQELMDELVNVTR